jgi:hypothetical protein
MATGFLQRFQGKVRISQLWIGKGGIVDAVSGIGGSAPYVQKVPLQAANATTTDYGPFSVPLGKTLLRASVYTGTAWAAVTDAKVSIGVSAGDQTYVAQTTIKAIGFFALTLAAAAAAALASLPTAPNLYVRVTQSGGNSATGLSTLVLEYA